MERIRVDITTKGPKPTKSLILEAFKHLEGNPRYHFVKPFRTVVDTVAKDLKVEFTADKTQWKATLGTVTKVCNQDNIALMYAIVQMSVALGYLTEEELTDIDDFV